MSFLFLLSLIVFVNALLLAIFLIYNLFFVLSFAGIRIFSRKKTVPQSDLMRKFAILVPAHNEETIIANIIRSARELDYPPSLFELMIIADNCADGTVEIAASENVTCLVRSDTTLKGKPYALQWALRQIDLDEYDAYAIIDADTVLDRNFLMAMNSMLDQGCDAIQGYFNLMNPDDSWLTRLGVFPGILKFKIRYFSKEHLGLTCPLMGNGMCFSRKIIKLYGWDAFSITENWEYYIRLVLRNVAVHYAENAVIFSYASTALSHSEAQRKRWFKGRMGVLKEYHRDLARKFIGEGDIRALDALVELAMPSYSMMLNWNIFLLGAATLLILAGSANISLVLFLSTLLLLQFVLFGIALCIDRPKLKSLLSIIHLPEFLAWKIYIVFKGLASLRDKSWEKTEHRSSPEI